MAWDEKSKLFSTAKNVKKSKKAHLLELQVRQAISQTLYELETSGMAYSTPYNQCLLHDFTLPMAQAEIKLFRRAKNVKGSFFDSLDTI